MRSLMTRSLVGQRRSRADEVGGYLLACFERHVKANRQSRTRKQPCVVKMNWMIESACHAGMLGDNRTPVGSAPRHILWDADKISQHPTFLFVFLLASTHFCFSKVPYKRVMVDTELLCRLSERYS